MKISQVSGVMSLDIGNGLAKTGLKSTTKLHTSTYLDGKVEVEGFKLAKATVNMPKDKMEILEVSAEFFTLTSDVWSFAVVLWELLSFGRTPYGPQDYYEVVKQNFHS